jgi:hypothetical protein
MVMKCDEVRRAALASLEEEMDLQLRSRVDQHLRGCRPCTAVFAGARNLQALLADPRSFQLPPAGRKRLYQKLDRHLKQGKGKVRLGIGGEFVSLGEHLSYFWENEDDFQAAVGFLEAGLQGEDHCVVFGHEEANQKVLDVLRGRGFDPAWLVSQKRLSVLGGRASGEAMLGEIGATFQAALAKGASALRLLGNIGWHRPAWPGDDDILAFEARVTGAARQFPCLVVCMYDVRSLPGRIILRGGFGTHPATICADALQHNPYYVPEEEFLAALGQQDVAKPQ